eukprot:1190393-Heterocapsa_arctica.AAC.1
MSDNRSTGIFCGKNYLTDNKSKDSDSEKGTNMRSMKHMRLDYKLRTYYKADYIYHNIYCSHFGPDRNRNASRPHPRANGGFEAGIGVPER